MKLSFVIPAHNEENYIRQCLKSVIEQAKKSGRDIEIIVVNNASTDRTREIAAEFPEIKIVDEPIKGLPQARHAGYLASTGELIANVDADSIVPPGWIEKVYDYFSRDSKLVALSGPYEFYDIPKFHHIMAKYVFYYPGHALHRISELIWGKSALLQGGNFILKRSALDQAGGYNLDIKFYGEDTDIARRIQQYGKVNFVFDLAMPTSARRIKKEGFVLLGAKYALNHFWTLIFKKPITKEYKDIRE